jgi:hypothetical protein
MQTRTGKGAILTVCLLGGLLSVGASILFSPPAAKAATTITVTRGDDGVNCGPQPVGETLRCAINEANSMGTGNTIQFAPSVTRVVASDTLPQIMSQGTVIDGALPGGGFVIIDAAGIASSLHNVLEIYASAVEIMHLAIINAPPFGYDIDVIGGHNISIAFDSLGLTVGASACNFPFHTRNSYAGVNVAPTVFSDGSVGSVYIFDNVIGCHSSSGTGKGISVYTSWTTIGSDGQGNVSPNYIGVSPAGNPLPNDDGIDFVSSPGLVTVTHNTVLNNIIAENFHYGIMLSGGATTANLISGTLLAGNGFDGICEGYNATDNVWSHLSDYNNNGLAINKQGACNYSGPLEAVDAPYPVISFIFDNVHVIVGTASGSSSNCLAECTRVELYRVWPDPKGFGDGRTFVGATTTDANGNWAIADPAYSGGCYVALQTHFQFLLSGSHDYSSEFGPNNCRTDLPLIRR